MFEEKPPVVSQREEGNHRGQQTEPGRLGACSQREARLTSQGGLHGHGRIHREVIGALDHGVLSPAQT